MLAVCHVQHLGVCVGVKDAAACHVDKQQDSTLQMPHMLLIVWWWPFRLHSNVRNTEASELRLCTVPLAAADVLAVLHRQLM